MQIERLLEKMEQAGLDGYYITKPINVNYVSGYTNHDAALLITAAEKYLFTDPRYLEQAGYECPDYHLVNWREWPSMAAAAAHVIEEKGLKTVGIEAGVMNVNTYKVMQDSCKAELVSFDNVVDRFRSIKSPEEIECSRIACDIACRAYERILKDIRVGVTERELMARLFSYMIAEGADYRFAGGILISGARTSLLHGQPTCKAIEYGDLVLMDYGCSYKGYLSDMTRTVVVGKATPKQKEVYEYVRRMQQDMLDVMKAGVRCDAVYKASIKAIEGTDYFQYHYNGVGHGVGMFIHEDPFLRPVSDDTVEEDVVITLEPGLYIPGWGGIRIEDQVWVHKDCNENFVWAPKAELIEL